MEEALKGLKGSLEDEVVGVTGGCGFLGSSIVAQLLAAGTKEVRVFDFSQKSFILEDNISALNDVSANDRLKMFTGDLTQLSSLRPFVKGCTSIIHTASCIGVHGDVEEADVWDINVGGTMSLIALCRELEVKNLLYTSSCEIVSGYKAHHNADESASICKPGEFLYGIYTETKAAAEDLVLKCGEGLHTVALRPVVMYGEGDKLHVGDCLYWLGLLGKYGMGGAILGTLPGQEGCSKMSMCYVANTAFAHLVAISALKDEKRLPLVDKQVFIICDDTPQQGFWESAKPSIEAVGLPFPKIGIPYSISIIIATIIELILFCLRPLLGRVRNPASRLGVNALAYTQTFSGEKAKCVLGFTPPYDYDTAMKRTIDWWVKHPTYNSFTQYNSSTTAEEKMSASTKKLE